MQNRRNYYRILHVQPDAPLAVIRASYRTLMQTLKQHPDLGGDHWNASLINEAYQTLADSVTRAFYDQQLFKQVNKASLCQAVSRAQGAQQQSIDDVTSFCCVFCKTPFATHLRHLSDAQCNECSCPLKPHQPLTFNPHEPRSIMRISQQGKISVCDYWPNSAMTATLQDLSPNGMRCIVPTLICPEQVLKLESCSFIAAGKVTRCQMLQQGQHYYSEIGIVFLSILFQRQVGNFFSASA